MAISQAWKDELKAFFDLRASAIVDAPTIEELCFIAGRDPRLWRDRALLENLKEDILARMDASPSARVLEVGCAAGFLASLVAPAVSSYTGIDLAEEALVAANRLGLSNATFEVADGGELAFASGSFDAAFCYEVFSNLPSFDDGAPLIAEMIRVVKPGGRVLVGSIPDAATKDDYPRRIAEISADLEHRYGPPPPQPKVVIALPEPSTLAVARPARLLDRLKALVGLRRPAAALDLVPARPPAIKPQI